MADKEALIKEVFELCNGQRNLRNWLHARADQFADAFAKVDSEKPALRSHFCMMAEHKVPDWLDVVVAVYDRSTTEQELDYAKAELIKFRSTGVIDPADEDLSEELRRTFRKLGLLQMELNWRMHQFLETFIEIAWSAYQARN